MRSVFICPLMTLAGVFSVATTVSAAQNGERWEYTSKMQSEQMQGFAMPAMTMQMCQEPGWKNPPKGQQQDSECTVKDYQKSGNTMSWRVECPQGKGRGEMTLQGNDKFIGFTEFSSAEGNFRMDMSGRKLGSCDPATDRTVVDGMNMPNAQEVQQMQQQMASGMSMSSGQNPQMCSMALQQMQPFLFKNGAPCAEQKTAFCARLNADGGKQLTSTDPSGEMMKMAKSICTGK